MEKKDLLGTLGQLRWAFHEFDVEIKEVILDEKSYYKLIEYLKQIQQIGFLLKEKKCPRCNITIESYVEYQDMKIRAG